VEDDQAHRISVACLLTASGPEWSGTVGDAAWDDGPVCGLRADCGSRLWSHSVSRCADSPRLNLPTKRAIHRSAAEMSPGGIPGLAGTNLPQDAGHEDHSDQREYAPRRGTEQTRERAASEVPGVG